MRCVKQAIRMECHATRTMNEIINDLNGAKDFSKLNLNQSYNKLELEESSHYITMFTIHMGLRQYTRLNFGISSAT